MGGFGCGLSGGVYFSIENIGLVSNEMNAMK